MAQSWDTKRRSQVHYRSSSVNGSRNQLPVRVGNTKLDGPRDSIESGFILRMGYGSVMGQKQKEPGSISLISSGMGIESSCQSELAIPSYVDLETQ